MTTYLNQLAASPLGKRPIASVKPSDIQAWVSNRSAVLAPQTVRNLFTWLKAIFAAAVEDGLIGRTPCNSKIALPALESADLVPLSREQVERLAEAVDPRYSAAIIVQAATGLRASELLGLQVRDVDFLRRQVKIERQLLRDGQGFGPPKTAKSRRTVPLAVDVVPVLSEHIRKFPPNDDGVIFTSTYGNPIRMNRWSAFIFKPAVERAGLPAGTSSHDLRHFYAAVLLRRGVPVNVVARYLGHASAALVLSTYSRLMPDSDDLVRATLDSVWSVTAESQAIEDDSASSV